MDNDLEKTDSQTTQPNDDIGDETEAQEFHAAFEQAEESVAGGIDESLVEPLYYSEIFVGGAVILIWLTFLAAGIIVNTQASRDIISGTTESAGFLPLLGAWFVVLSSYTITNLAFLSCLAATGGEFCTRTRSIESAEPNEFAHASWSGYANIIARYTAAGMRGFVVYLLVIGGFLLITNDAFTSGDPDTMQQRYIRLAGTLSVAAFMTGYDKTVFRKTLDRIVSVFSQPKTGGSAKS